METASLVDMETPICLPCDPRRKLHRYLMLFFICFICFGSYFCYDNPAALQDTFLKVLNMDVTAFMKMYSLYSWPNVILSFIGGYLLDNVFGLRWGAFIFAMIIFVSQLIFAAGVYSNMLWVIYLGRFMYGIGGESLCVAQNTYCISWFPMSEINFVFGLQLSVSRLGSTVNMNVMEKLYQYIVKNTSFVGPKALGFTLFLAAITCIYSLVCSGIMIYFDKRKELILGPVNSDKKKEEEDTVSVNSQENENASDEEAKKKKKKMGFSLVEILYFPAAIWWICLICVFYYISVFPFVAVGQTFFERKFKCSVEYASLVNSMIYIVSAAACPVLGTLIDCTGKNIIWLALGTLITMACHALFAFIPGGTIPPILLTIVMGLSYSILASSLWPMVGMVLPSKYHGTAYGIIQSIQNLGLALSMLLAGVIIDHKGYFFLELTFIFFLYVAFAGVIFIYFWDLRNGGKLNQSARERKKELEDEKIDAEL